MNTLYVCCGPAGIGKSTWLKNNINKIVEGCAVVSRDAIRFEMVKPNEPYFSKEDKVLAKFYSVIAKSLEYSDVVVDSTNVSVSARRKLFLGINKYVQCPYHTAAIDFYKNNMLEICLDQNALRTGRERVPDDVVQRMVGQFQRPSTAEGFEKVYHVIGNGMVERRWV